MPRLIIVDQEGGGERAVELGGAELVLGRDPNVDVHLDSPKVSRRHARVYRAKGAYWIEDLKSSNGVYVEGQRITAPARLTPGAEVKLSVFALWLEAEGEEQGEQSAPSGVAPTEQSMTQALPAGSFVLIGVSEAYVEQRFPLTGASVTVGRAAECGVSIPDPSMSRQHARLNIGASSITVQDLGSSNGTFINEARIERADAHIGDQLRFGDVTCELRYEVAEPPPPRFSAGPVIAVTVALITLIGVGTGAFLWYRGREARNATRARFAAYEAAINADLVNAQKAYESESWQEAEQLFRLVLEKDPLNAVARTGSARAASNRVEKSLVTAAQQDLAANKPGDALAKVSGVSDTSYYAAIAGELRTQARDSLAGRALAAARAACKNENWRECHRNAVAVLEVAPDSAIGKALAAEAENGLRSQGVSFKAWTSAGRPLPPLDGTFGDPEIRCAALRYAVGDCETALKRARNFDNRAGASRVTSQVVELMRAREEGDALARGGSFAAAVAPWEKALAADAALLPPEHPSAPRAEVQAKLADALAKVGEDAANRGAWVEAFAAWQRGLGIAPMHPALLAGIRRLEARAAGILRDLPTGAAPTAVDCSRLDEVLTTTLPASETRKAAEERRRACK